MRDTGKSFDAASLALVGRLRSSTVTNKGAKMSSSQFTTVMHAVPNFSHELVAQGVKSSTLAQVDHASRDNLLYNDRVILAQALSVRPQDLPPRDWFANKTLSGYRDVTAALQSRERLLPHTTRIVELWDFLRTAKLDFTTISVLLGTTVCGGGCEAFLAHPEGSTHPQRKARARAYLDECQQTYLAVPAGPRVRASTANSDSRPATYTFKGDSHIAGTVWKVAREDVRLNEGQPLAQTAASVKFGLKLGASWVLRARSLFGASPDSKISRALGLGCFAGMVLGLLVGLVLLPIDAVRTFLYVIKNRKALNTTVLYADILAQIPDEPFGEMTERFGPVRTANSAADFSMAKLQNLFSQMHASQHGIASNELNPAVKNLFVIDIDQQLIDAATLLQAQQTAVEHAAPQPLAGKLAFWVANQPQRQVNNDVSATLRAIAESCKPCAYSIRAW